MKVEDWIYHNFELCQIKQMAEDRITEITTGNFETNGYNLICFPLNVRNHVISQEFQYQYGKINKYQGLNFSDIFSYFIDIWQECCEDKNDEHLTERYQKIYEFVNNVESLVEQRKKTKIHDVDIFK